MPSAALALATSPAVPSVCSARGRITASRASASFQSSSEADCHCEFRATKSKESFVHESSTVVDDLSAVRHRAQVEPEGGSSYAAKLFRQMQLFLEVLNDVLEFREIFRGRLDQGLVSFQHRLRPSGAVFFQPYWKSLPVLLYGAHAYVEKLVQPQATH